MGSVEEQRQWRKESVNLETDQQKVSNLNNREQKESSLGDLWDNIQMPLMSKKKKKRRKKAEQKKEMHLFEEMMTDNFLNLIF